MLSGTTGLAARHGFPGMQRAAPYPAPAAARPQRLPGLSLLVTFISVSAERGLRGAAAIAVRAASRVVRGTGGDARSRRAGGTLRARRGPCAASRPSAVLHLA